MENITKNLKQKISSKIVKTPKHSIPRLSKVKYYEKVLQIKRVTKVVQGGKRLSFRALVVVGDMTQKVGIGIGKGSDVSLAIDKAILVAKKQLICIRPTKTFSIFKTSSAKVGAASIILRPASIGTGLIAGGAVRTILELAGLKNILAKQLGSKSLLNNAKATIKALLILENKIEISKTQLKKSGVFYNKILQNQNLENK